MPRKTFDGGESVFFLPIACREIPYQNNGSAHGYLVILLFYLLSARTSFTKITGLPIVN